MQNELAKLRQLTETLTSNGYLTDQTHAWKYAFDSVNELVCITNPSFRIKFINKSLIDKLNLTHRVFLNKKIYQVLEDAMFLEDDTAIETIYYDEIYIESLDGWFERKRCSITNSSGRLIGYTFMLIDVTERRLVEQALYDSEIKNRALQEATVEAVFFSDNGKCIEANVSASKMFGYTYKEFVGILGTDVIADEFKSVVKKNMLSGYNKPYEVLAQKKDGSKFWAEVQGKIFNYRGKKVRVTSVRDISERKQIEEKLHETNSLLRVVLDTIPDILSVQDVDHHILMYNKAAKKFFNVTSKELVGKQCYEILGRKSICEDCKAKIVKSTKKPVILERFIKELDGWYDCRWYPVFDNNGNVTKVVEHLVNIDKCKQDK